MIGAMRKKGEDTKNGISKVRGPEKGKPVTEKGAYSQHDEKIIKGPRPATWSARDAGLCGDKPLPDPELRRGTR